MFLRGEWFIIFASLHLLCVSIISSRKPSRMKSQDEEDNVGILNLIMNKISMLQPQDNLNSVFEPEGTEKKSLPAMDKKNSTSKATTNNKSLTHV